MRPSYAVEQPTAPAAPESTESAEEPTAFTPNRKMRRQFRQRGHRQNERDLPWMTRAAIAEIQRLERNKGSRS